MYRLHLALKHLAAKHPLRNLRFFGKIFGLRADYYIAEGEMDPDTPEEESERVLEGAAGPGKDALGNALQPMGSGPNKHVYFVCKAIGEPWTRLPHVTPHQIIVARKMKQYLTGDLDAPVAGHPPFPGRERDYLRALVALIAAGTVVMPSGLFQAVDGDEEGNIEPVAEEEAAAPEDMGQPDAWVHQRLDLNALGRTRPNPPVVGDDGEEVADPDAPEPSVPLKAISEDAPVDEAAEEGGGAWAVRVLPAGGKPEGEEATGGPGAVCVARSLRFPGAVCVAFQKKRFANVYCGYGHAVALTPFQPQLPFDLPKEYDFTAEETRVQEKGDVATDPTPPKPEGEEEGEAAEEE
jgi:radial spoke head protein 4A